MHHIEDARWQSGFGEQLREEKRGAGDLFTGLEKKRIATRNRKREHPERNHCREVKWGDPHHDTKRKAPRVAVHTARNFEKLSRQKLGQRAGKLHTLQPFLDACLSLSASLAALTGDGGSQLWHPGLGERFEAKQRLHSVFHRELAPGSKRRARCCNCRVPSRIIREADLSKCLAVPGGSHGKRRLPALDRLAVDPVCYGHRLALLN